MEFWSAVLSLSLHFFLFIHFWCVLRITLEVISSFWHVMLPFAWTVFLQEDFDEFSDVDELYSTLPLDKVESLEDLVTIGPPALVKVIYIQIIISSNFFFYLTYLFIVHRLCFDWYICLFCYTKIICGHFLNSNVMCRIILIFNAYYSWTQFFLMFKPEP